jgi:hypothetical protein
VAILPPLRCEMSISYLKYVNENMDYYINQSTDEKDLMRTYEKITEARKELDEMERRIYLRINEIQNIQKYKEIVVRRNKNWSGKVDIFVGVFEYKSLDGERVGNSYSIGKHEKFNGNEKKKAIEFANELKATYRIPVVFENWK